MSGPWPSFWSVCVNTFGVAPSHDGSEFWLRDGPWSPWWHSTICCQWPRGCWPWGAMSGGRRRGEGGRHEWRARSQPAVTLGEIGNIWEWGYLELFVLSCWPAVPVVLVQYQKSVLSLFVAKFGTHTHTQHHPETNFCLHSTAFGRVFPVRIRSSSSSFTLMDMFPQTPFYMFTCLDYRMKLL